MLRKGVMPIPPAMKTRSLASWLRKEKGCSGSGAEDDQIKHSDQFPRIRDEAIALYHVREQVGQRVNEYQDRTHQAGGPVNDEQPVQPYAAFQEPDP